MAMVNNAAGSCRVGKNKKLIGKLAILWPKEVSRSKIRGLSSLQP
jgi:hypothetical protein